MTPDCGNLSEAGEAAEERRGETHFIEEDLRTLDGLLGGEGHSSAGSGVDRRGIGSG